MRHILTKETIKEMAYLRMQRWPIDAIALCFGVSYNTVQVKTNDFLRGKLIPFPFRNNESMITVKEKEDFKKAVIKDYQEGMSVKDIAKKYGLSYTKILRTIPTEMKVMVI